MNYKAAALMAATMVLGGCGPTGQQTDAGATAFPDWESWKKAGKWTVGEAEILADAAHVRFGESGKVMKIMGLKPLVGEEAEKAVRFLSETIEGKKVRCWWIPKAAELGDPRAVTADGAPLAACKVRNRYYTRCTTLACNLTNRAISAGYGRFEGGEWETRSPGATRRRSELTSLQEKAAQAGIGIWDK